MLNFTVVNMHDLFHMKLKDRRKGNIHIYELEIKLLKQFCILQLQLVCMTN